jgi:aryl-alcohol dehydrogenase-like predicted oxidoreductase
MQRRRLGSRGPEVSPLGLGCMGMTGIVGAATDELEAQRTIDRALELGINFLDTADVYGPHANEELVGRALKDRRGSVILATKFGLRADSSAGGQREVNGSPEYVRAACDASLKRLGVDTIDLYYYHRVDRRVPIEETVGAMADLVHTGKVRFLGLSEVSPETLRRAHAVHPITAVQSEYSLWNRDPEASILPACRELGVGFVPFSPLGRGFLAGGVTSVDQLPPGDFRRGLPRFAPGNFETNLDWFQSVRRMAAEKSVTAGQLALAWLLARPEGVVPIPGSRRRSHLEENAAAATIVLSPAELRELDQIAPLGVAQGERYPESLMRLTNG